MAKTKALDHGSGKDSACKNFDEQTLDRLRDETIADVKHGIGLLASESFRLGWEVDADKSGSLSRQELKQYADKPVDRTGCNEAEIRVRYEMKEAAKVLLEHYDDVASMNWNSSTWTKDMREKDGKPGEINSHNLRVLGAISTDRRQIGDTLGFSVGVEGYLGLPSLILGTSLLFARRGGDPLAILPLFIGGLLAIEATRDLRAVHEFNRAADKVNSWNYFDVKAQRLNWLGRLL